MRELTSRSLCSEGSEGSVVSNVATARGRCRVAQLSPECLRTARPLAYSDAASCRQSLGWTSSCCLFLSFSTCLIIFDHFWSCLIIFVHFCISACICFLIWFGWFFNTFFKMKLATLRKSTPVKSTGEGERLVFPVFWPMWAYVSHIPT